MPKPFSKSELTQKLARLNRARRTLNREMQELAKLKYSSYEAGAEKLSIHGHLTQIAAEEQIILERLNELT